MALRDTLNDENGTLSVHMEVLCEDAVHLVNAASLRNPTYFNASVTGGVFVRMRAIYAQIIFGAGSPSA